MQELKPTDQAQIFYPTNQLNNRISSVNIFLFLDEVHFHYKDDVKQAKLWILETNESKKNR